MFCTLDYKQDLSDTLYSLLLLCSLFIYHSFQKNDITSFFWGLGAIDSLDVRHNQTVLDKQEAFIVKWKTKPLFHSL